MQLQCSDPAALYWGTLLRAHAASTPQRVSDQSSMKCPFRFATGWTLIPLFLAGDSLAVWLHELFRIPR